MVTAGAWRHLELPLLSLCPQTIRTPSSLLQLHSLLLGWLHCGHPQTIAVNTAAPRADSTACLFSCLPSFFLAEQLPPNEYYEYYGPEFRLTVQVGPHWRMVRAVPAVEGGGRVQAVEYWLPWHRCWLSDSLPHPWPRIPCPLLMF